MQGADLAQWMLQHAHLAGVRRVLYSAIVPEQLEREVAQRGMTTPALWHAYLRKGDVTLDEVIAQVHTLTNQPAV
jgi:hypothetical protein